ncbi:MULTISPECIES: hypothetical protein [Enterobacteriaceae]|uniref:hypothetical protein n=1 Tax=Enterobacteriaceae TaxID=543 RepID=UPI001F60F04A|nr:hypothetical protein [Enterobacter roggenkampii]
MNINIRPAQLSDVKGIFTVRTSVAENHLSREEMREMDITETTVSNMIKRVIAHGLRQMMMKWWVFR